MNRPRSGRARDGRAPWRDHDAGCASAEDELAPRRSRYARFGHSELAPRRQLRTVCQPHEPPSRCSTPLPPSRCSHRTTSGLGDGVLGLYGMSWQAARPAPPLSTSHALDAHLNRRRCLVSFGARGTAELQSSVSSSTALVAVRQGVPAKMISSEVTQRRGCSLLAARRLLPEWRVGGVTIGHVGQLVLRAGQCDRSIFASSCPVGFLPAVWLERICQLISGRRQDLSWPKSLIMRLAAPNASYLSYPYAYRTAV